MHKQNQIKLKPGLRGFYTIQPLNRSDLLYSSWGLHEAVLAKNYDFYNYATIQSVIQCKSKKSHPRGPDIFHFFHKRFRIANWFFTHLLNVLIFARLQIFIQLSPILTKLCHIKRDNPVHIICAKCPNCAKKRAFRRLRKSLIDLLIVVCGKSL